MPIAVANLNEWMNTLDMTKRRVDRVQLSGSARILRKVFGIAG